MARFGLDELQADKLFVCLAEQIKLPLIQIASTTEAMTTSDVGSNATSQREIIDVSQAAVRLIDGFLMSVRMQNQQQLDLEPVPISSILYDTAEMLDNYAKIHRCELQLEIAGKYSPVMANAAAIKSALTNLGYSFIANTTNDRRRIVKLVVRRNKNGISTGVFADTPGLSSSLFKKAKDLQGLVHQPMAEFASDNAAGVFVANNLFSGLGSKMHVSRLREMTGLAATFTPSRQLNLV